MIFLFDPFGLSFLVPNTLLSGGVKSLFVLYCLKPMFAYVCWPNVQLVKSIFIIFILIFWLIEFPAILGSWFHAPAWDFPRFAAFWAVVSGSHRKLNYREPFGRLQGSWQPWNARSPWKKGSGRWWFWLASFFAGICKVMGWKMMASGMSSMSLRWKMLNFYEFLLVFSWNSNNSCFPMGEVETILHMVGLY